MVKRKNKKESVIKSKSKTEIHSPEPQQEPNNTGIHWKENIKYVRRTFPGPPKVMVPLRVAIDRGAFVNMTEHVMKSIDVEVCGVMVGEVCRDDESIFVHVKNIIQGSAAHQGGAHVTFTHDTWNQIHYHLENDFPDYDILGWYHSHPGFGVVFSEMDLFIQRNFFSSPTQFALVIDPLGGEKALCVNTSSNEIQYINKFWVDGREYHAFQPERKGGMNAVNSHSDQSLGMIETRLNQVLLSLDKLSLNIFRTLIIMGSLILAMMVTVIFYLTVVNPTRDIPPKVRQYVPVPVQIDGKEVLLGVGIVDWRIPPELIDRFNEVREKSEKNDAGTQEKDKQHRKNWLQSVFDKFISIVKKESAEKKDNYYPGSPNPGTKQDTTPKNSNSNPRRGEKNDAIK